MEENKTKQCSCHANLASFFKSCSIKWFSSVLLIFRFNSSAGLCSVASVPGTAEYTGKWRKIKPVFMSCRPELFSLYCLRALCKRLEERHQRSEANAGGYIFCRIIERHKISVLQCADINLVQSANRSINQNNNTIPLVLQE